VQTWMVTGAAGFIGSNFVRHALGAPDRRVVGVDKLTYAGHLASLRDVSGHAPFAFVRADIADATAMASLVDTHQPDAIVNFAAETHVDRSIDGPRAFVETNLVGTFTLLDAARRFWSGLPADRRDAFRFLHISTDEVYGTLGAEGAFSEETRYAPNSPYSATKAGADHLVRAYHHTYQLPTLITNCSNNYGPFQYPEKLIPLVILNALEGKPLPIYGDGLNVRDWLFVEDHCDGIVQVLARGRTGEHYNIGGSQEKTNLEIVDTICDLLDRLAPVADNPRLTERSVRSYRDLKTFVPDRPGHDRRYAIDARKIRRELGWSPRFDLQSGLEHTVRWYLDHRDWCEEVQTDRYARERLGLGQPVANPPA
jgi:dTDP-glucose 4,6-dehydratase